MSRSSDQRVTDIRAAVERIDGYRHHINSADEVIASMAYGAICVSWLSSARR